MSSSERSSERGSATVLVLVLVAVLTTLAIAATTVGGILVGHRRAAAAADLAALAAAEALVPGAGISQGGPDGCAQAGLVSSANDARLTACEVDGRDVVVAVTVDVRMPFGATRSVPGRARAGPAEVSSSGGPDR